MRTVAYAAVLAACFGAAGVAQAADLGYPGSLKDGPYWSPAALWSGLYVGGHIGGAWGDVDVTDEYDYAGDPIKKSAFGTSGLIGGAQIGYNIQRGSIVYGIEADVGYLSLDGSKTVDLPPPFEKRKDPNAYLTGTYKSSGGLYGDLTGRLGYASKNALFYLKGGMAFLNATINAHYAGENCTTTGTRCRNYDGDPNPSVFDFEHSDTMWGWTIGAGVEYALTPSLSIKGEYQHFDFGTTSFSHNGEYKFLSDYNECPDHWCSRLHGKADVDVTVDAVKLGVNYRLNGTGAALK